jgi:hemerythrin
VQHRELLSVAEKLESAARSGNLQRAADVLAFLERYARDHFADEERRMEEAGYPRLAEHRAAHEAFAAELARRKAAFEASRSLASLTMDLGDWLGAWLEDHLRHADADMVRHLRERGS